MKVPQIGLYLMAAVALGRAGQRDPKADVIKHLGRQHGGVTRRARGALRNSQPRPSTKSPIGAGRWAEGIVLHCSRVLPHPIPAPLPDIAGHIVEAEIIGTEGTDWAGPGMRVGVGRMKAQSWAGIVGEICCSPIVRPAMGDHVRIGPGKAKPFVSTSRGNFPLRFRRQPIAVRRRLEGPIRQVVARLAAVHQAQEIAVGDSAIPTNQHARVLPSPGPDREGA